MCREDHHLVSRGLPSNEEGYLMGQTFLSALIKLIDSFSFASLILQR